MKITKNRIKEIILEELGSITENESLIRQIVMDFAESKADKRTGKTFSVVSGDRLEHMIQDLESALEPKRNNISDLRGDNL